jgi:hypothetical protein
MSGGRRRIVRVAVDCDNDGCDASLEKIGSPGYAIQALADDLESQGWQVHANPRDPGVWGPLISDQLPRAIEYKIPDLCPRCVLAQRIKEQLNQPVPELDQTIDEPIEIPISLLGMLGPHGS